MADKERIFTRSEVVSRRDWKNGGALTLEELHAAHAAIGNDIQIGAVDEMGTEETDWMPLLKQMRDEAVEKVAQSIAEQALSAIAPTAEPPGSYWFELAMPPKVGRDFLANLDELFETDCERHGARRARLMYRVQCGKMVVRHWFDVSIEAIQKIRKTII